MIDYHQDKENAYQKTVTDHKDEENSF